MRLRWIHAALPALAFSLACAAEINSNVTVDGKQFVADECRNGVVYGFSGVELADSLSNQKLRLVSNPDGTTNAILMDNGAATGTDLGSCGTLSLEMENSEINGVTNVGGTATLSCSVDGRTVAGDVDFAHCH